MQNKLKLLLANDAQEYYVDIQYIVIYLFVHHVSHISFSDTVNKQTNIWILGEICAMCKKYYIFNTFSPS